MEMKALMCNSTFGIGFILATSFSLTAVGSSPDVGFLSSLLLLLLMMMMRIVKTPLYLLCRILSVYYSLLSCERQGPIE